MSGAPAFVVRAGRRAADHVREHGIRPQDIGCIPGAAGGPKGLALLPLDRLLHEHWLRGAADVHLVGASIGAWRMAALAQPDAPAALDRLQQAYVHGQRYAHRPSPDQVASVCRAIVRTVLGAVANGPLARRGVALQIVAARARGGLDRQLSKSAFGRAMIANAISRSRLGDYLERVVFHAGEAPFLREPFDRFGLLALPLTHENAEDALLASGTIPIVCAPVTQIARAPHGHYWDGALIDYHLLLPYPRGRLVLYPHFNDYVTPGWLDKHLPWRRTARGHAWLDDVLLVAPSPEFIATLPNRKLPDRQDLYRYGLDHAGREAAWDRAIAECGRFAEAVMRWLERPDPSVIHPL